VRIAGTPVLADVKVMASITTDPEEFAELAVQLLSLTSS